MIFPVRTDIYQIYVITFAHALEALIARIDRRGRHPFLLKKFDILLNPVRLNVAQGDDSGPGHRGISVDGKGTAASQANKTDTDRVKGSRAQSQDITLTGRADRNIRLYHF